jgi:hypothetical protein
VYQPVVQTGLWSKKALQHVRVVLKCDAKCPSEAVMCLGVD